MNLKKLNEFKTNWTKHKLEIMQLSMESEGDSDKVMDFFIKTLNIITTSLIFEKSIAGKFFGIRRVTAIKMPQMDMT